MSFDLQLCPGPGDCQLLTVNCACVMLVRMQLSGGWGGYWDITENTQGETWKWHSFMFKESVDASGHIINFGKVQRCAVHTFYILKQECPHFDGRELESFDLFLLGCFFQFINCYTSLCAFHEVLVNTFYLHCTLHSIGAILKWLNKPINNSLRFWICWNFNV